MNEKFVVNVSDGQVCHLCRGKYFRNEIEGANTADVVKEFGKCAAMCAPSLSSASAKCNYSKK